MWIDQTHLPVRTGYGSARKMRPMTPNVGLLAPPLCNTTRQLCKRKFHHRPESACTNEKLTKSVGFYGTLFNPAPENSDAGNANKGSTEMNIFHRVIPPYHWFTLLMAAWLALWLFAPAHAQSDPPIHPDGWDLSFGGDGRAEGHCPGGADGYAAPVFFPPRPDGKILLFADCSHDHMGNQKPTLLRFLPDGTPDPTFGSSGQASVTANYRAGITQATGKVVLASDAPNGVNYRLTRYQDNGALDTSFGVQGIFTLPGESTIGYMRGLLVQPNDKILVWGDLQIVRATADGALDSTFHGTGLVAIADLLPISAGSLSGDVNLLGATIQSDGKSLLVIKRTSQEGDFERKRRFTQVVARLNLDGTLDSSFADSGLYTVFDQRQPATVEWPQVCGGILAQANDKIVIPNVITRQFVRLQGNGLLDTTFTPEPDSLGCWFLYNGVQDSIIAVDKSNESSLTRWYANGKLADSFTINMNGAKIVGVQPDGSLIAYTGGRTDGDFELLRNVKTLTLPEPTTPSLPPNQRPLALIYAVLDNNLGDDWPELFNKIEAGVHTNMDVRLMVDGPGANDAYVYQMQEDHNPFCPSESDLTCNGRYSDGSNRWKFFTEDTAQSTSLYQFVLDSLQAYPQAPQVTLALVGHGSGWGANVLPAQPSFWKKQNDTLGGMLWDDHTGGQRGTRSLSTLALGNALRGAQTETGRRIDLLYLDGCSMGMTEIAYELADAANYLLASPNTDWATFSYDQLLPEVKNGVDAHTLGLRWLAHEAALLRSQPGHPFTLALTDLGQMSQFSTTVSALGDALQSALPTQRAQITQAFTASDRYDSNYDAKLDDKDNYLDLKAFAQQLRQVGLTNSTVISAAQQVETVLASAVISTAYASGAPWVAEEQSWTWQTMGGLSIYAPLGQDEAKRRIYYNSNNLTWADDTTWDEFLSAFWANNGGISVATANGEMPVCQATTDGCTGLANPQPTVEKPVQTLYLTLVKR